MKKCIHKCKWKKTGCERYTFPGQYELKCESCGKTKWKEYKEGIPKVTLKPGTPEWEEFRKKYFNGN